VLSPQSHCSKASHSRPHARMKQACSKSEAGLRSEIANRARHHLSAAASAASSSIPGTESSWNHRLRKQKHIHSCPRAQSTCLPRAVYFNAGGVTPALWQPPVLEAGSDYAFATLDCRQNPFDGARPTDCVLPPNVPGMTSGAPQLYDTQTRLDVADQPTFPTVGSQDEDSKKMQTAHSTFIFRAKGRL